MQLPFPGLQEPVFHGQNSSCSEKLFHSFQPTPQEKVQHSNHSNNWHCNQPHLSAPLNHMLWSPVLGLYPPFCVLDTSATPSAQTRHKARIHENT